MQVSSSFFKLVESEGSESRDSLKTGSKQRGLPLEQQRTAYTGTHYAHLISPRYLGHKEEKQTHGFS